MATANNMTASASTAPATSESDSANSSNSNSLASSGSILQNRLYSQSAGYGSTPGRPYSMPVISGQQGQNISASSSRHNSLSVHQPEDQDLGEGGSSHEFWSDLQQPESPSFKMKIKRSNSSSNYSNGEDFETGRSSNGVVNLNNLQRQLTGSGPPSKKAKLNGDFSNGSVESNETASPASMNTDNGNFGCVYFKCGYANCKLFIDV